MANINNQQFNSLNNIKFVRDLTPEIAANYSGGGCGTLTSRSGNQQFSDSDRKTGNSDVFRAGVAAGFTPFVDKFVPKRTTST